MREFSKVATLSEVSPGEKIRIDYQGEDVILINVGGDIFAISDICTHDGEPLIDGDIDCFEIECPRHGARFNIKTGEETPPAFEPVPIYDVRIEGTAILIAPRNE